MKSIGKRLLRLGMLCLSLCVSCNRGEVHHLYFRGNEVDYRFSAEQVAIGELFLVRFRFHLAAGVQSAALTTTEGAPPGNRLFDCVFSDASHREAVAEWVWDEAGEKVIDGLAVEFTDFRGKRERVPLEPFCVEVVSFDPFQPETLLSDLKPLRPLPPIGRWALFCLVAGSLYLFSFLFLFFFLLLKKRRRKKELKTHADYFQRCRAADQLMAYYRLLREGSSLLPELSPSVASVFLPQANRLLSELAPCLFSPEPTPLRECSSVQAAHFTQSFREWTGQLQQAFQKQYQREGHRPCSKRR